MLFSFDVFDTLIRRKTNKPSDIFLLVQKVLQTNNNEHFSQFIINNFSELRLKAEHNARNLNNSEEITLNDIYNMFSFFTGINEYEKNELIKLELQIEKDSIIGINENICYLKRLLQEGKKVVLISDMYMSQRDIRELLISVDEVFEKLPIYVSSEYNATKRTGRLYKIVKEREKVQYTSWIHFGDNHFSDGCLPELLGITPRIVLSDFELDIEKKWVNKYGYSKNLFLTLTLGIVKKAMVDRIDSVPTLTGILIGGPVVLQYIMWLCESCKKFGIHRLYFIARDGYVLKRVFDIYSKIMDIPVDSYYIFGSRIAWRVEDEYKKENLKNYILQEIDFSDENFAFVDTHGSGKSIECIQKLINCNLKVFYYDLERKIPNEHIQAYTFNTSINGASIELLCRAPHGVTIGYYIEDRKWTPKLATFSDELIKQSGIKEYVNGVEYYVNEITDLIKKLNISIIDYNICDFIIDYFMNNPSYEIASFFGDIIQSGDDSIQNRFAPELVTNDIDNYFINKNTYKGTDFLYSLKRSSEEVNKYYLYKNEIKMNRENDDKKNVDIIYKISKKRAAKANIILYGAGKKGKEAFVSINNNKYVNIIAWVDIAYQKCQNDLLPVISLREAIHLEYDYVVISIMNEIDNIVFLLTESGVATKKIIRLDRFYELIDWN